MLKPAEALWASPFQSSLQQGKKSTIAIACLSMLATLVASFGIVGAAASDLLDLSWSSREADVGSAVAWGDYDGDGDLDLAVGGGFGRPNRIYRNDNGLLNPNAAWQSSETGYSLSVGWGDYDQDGDLDLAVGGYDVPTRLYRNDNGLLSTSVVWTAQSANSIAWGDYDGDGDLDLALGSYGSNQLHRNDFGILTANPVWTSTESEPTYSIAWGDYDNDGDLDLVATGLERPIRLYLNTGGALTSSAFWSSSVNGQSEALAWADYDKDGDLDLAQGGTYDHGSQLYRNSGGVLSSVPVWTSSEFGDAKSIAWGDFDSDDDLDLAIGYWGYPNRLYRNDGGALTTTAVWSSPLEHDVTASIAWGDFDGDGDLDLAAGTNGPERVYRNNIGVVPLDVAWFSAEQGNTTSVAWGDYDGDLDLDLAVGGGYGLVSVGEPSRLYRNDGGFLTARAVWSSAESDETTSIAWGDVDGDGDLDLAAGTNYGPSRLYDNENGILTLNAVWSSEDIYFYRDLAWGDYDNDGDIDLAFASWFYGAGIYRNDSGTLTSHPIWSTRLEVADTTSVVWGDYDNDGDLDLAVGVDNCVNCSWPSTKLYRNDRGTLTEYSVWSSDDSHSASSVAWGDYDSDGDLDLVSGGSGPISLYRNSDATFNGIAVWSSQESGEASTILLQDHDSDGDVDLTIGNGWWPNRIYHNDHGSFLLAPWPNIDLYSTSVAYGDYDRDGDLDLAVGRRGNSTIVYQNGRDRLSLVGSIPTLYLEAPNVRAGFGSSPLVSGSVIPVSFTLRDLQSDPVDRVEAYYSPNGGGQWFPAIAAAGTITTQLSTSSSGQAYTYTWDVAASGFFGQSDNVVFRMKAVPDIVNRLNSIPGPYLYGSYAAQTFPFRARGTQARVLSDTVPVANTLVYRLPAGQTLGAHPFADLAGNAFRTDGQGYLQGRGELYPGDRLVALLPITATSAYTVYATSATPTETGLDMYTVTTGGVQTLTVSAANPLILFDLDVSLEWDARNDTEYLNQLAFDFERASQILYDATNGQVALGDVRIHHAQGGLADADVRIFATNALRPYATKGGVVMTPTTELALGQIITYTPGQVIMGASWNRYGNPGQRLGEDYARTLAHELAHWMLYQDDNYRGLDAQGRLIAVENCRGTLMWDAYLDANSEFHPGAEWAANCSATLAANTTGRSDWATIVRFYPWLHAPTTPLEQVNPGPSSLPLAVTKVRFVEPITATTVLPDGRFYLKDSGGASLIPGANARIVLFRDGGQTIIDQGRPVVDQAVARGAQSGDRLCVYDPAGGQAGCKVLAGVENQELELGPVAGWQPDVRLTLPTSRTVMVRAHGLPAGLSLRATLHSAAGVISQTLGYTGGVYGATLSTGGITAGSGQVLLQVINTPDSAPRETLTEYALGGNVPIDYNPNKWDNNPNKWDNNPNKWDSNAPVISSDGQLIVYAPEAAFPAGSYYVIQQATVLPGAPGWATPVGKGYWLTASGTAPDLSQAALSLTYAQSDVPAGAEAWLRLYHWNGVAWTALPTDLDADDNSAIAPAAGPGLYALMAAVEVPLYGPGWNNIAYSVPGTRSLTSILEPVADAVSVVYQYIPATNQWRVYPPGAPGYVGDLDQMEFGSAYWIYATRPITLPLAFPPGEAGAPESGLFPPATFYGSVSASGDFDPIAGMPVEARIGGQVCGQGAIENDAGEPVYVVKVSSDVERAGCGLDGRMVEFWVNGRRMQPAAAWDNRQAQPAALAAEPSLPSPIQVFLPLVER